MSPHRLRPARAAIWLLRRVSSRDATDAAVGDILETLDELHAIGRGPRWPSAWLYRQLLGTFVAAMLTAAPRQVRSAGHVLRDAARSLRRAPAHALFILLILAVGIATATITFSVVDTVVLRPLPFEAADQLVTISRVSRSAPEQLKALREDVPGFDSVARVTVLQTLPITAGGVTDDLSVSHAPADLFRVLRLKPLIGQLWTVDDELRGDTRVAVIGHALWQRRFTGDPAVLGRTLQIGDVSYRIVAVMPAGADFEELGWSVQLWVPGVPGGVRDVRSSTGAVLGRLRPGVSLAQVNEQITRAVVPAPVTNPGGAPARPPAAAPWLDSYVRNVRTWMLLALGVVGLVVFIACVNAANVMLTRSTQRAHDLAVRASLGASRRTLASSMLAESLMLSTGAGLIALLFSVWGIGVARTMLPRGIFRAASISLDGRVFFAALTAAIVTGLLCGAVPAWQASRASVITLLKDASTTVTRSRRTWRSAFLVIEIACIAALLVVSTLFIASFVRVVSIDLGFDRSKLLAVATVTNYQGTVDEVQQRLAQVPGVTGVAAVGSSSLPLISSAFGGAWGQTKLRVDGAAADVAPISIEYYRVTPNYFDVAGAHFQRGSTWSSSVASSDWHPMVIDAAAARTLFGERDPVGLRVLADGELKDVFTIVGVIPYAYTHGPELTTRPSAYVPMRPNAKPSWISFLLRTSTPPAGLVRDVEGVMASIAPPDPSPGAGVRAIDDGYQRLTAVRRFNATLMSTFALVAILIGAAGIYAVTASVVAQQTREIGVRVALGATAGHIRRGVFGQAARHVLLGLAIGLPAAWWISRGFGALFFQVGPSDPSIYLIVSVVIGAVAILAALVPARRASRVNPIVSLRNS